jgi:hypothetical protein
MQDATRARAPSNAGRAASAGRESLQHDTLDSIVVFSNALLQLQWFLSLALALFFVGVATPRVL